MGLALIIDKKTSEFVDIPLLPSSTNLTARSAHLIIEPDGSAFGNASVDYTGNESIVLKTDLYSKWAEYQSTHWREDFGKEIPNFTSRNESIENLTDNAKPLSVHFDMRLQNYASKTGKRLLIQAAVFTRGRKSLFPSVDRLQDVNFRCPWVEKDHIVFTVPEGYVLEEIPDRFCWMQKRQNTNSHLNSRATN